MDPSLNENLITTKYAGELSGYTSDYVSRLLRSGKIVGKRIGRNWLVERESFVRFLDIQGNHNVDRARTLATDRAKEYRAHRSLLHRATKSLTTSPSVSKPTTIDGSSPFSEIPRWSIASSISTGKFGSHIVALAASFLVIGSSALVVHTPVVSTFAMETKGIVLDVLYGFSVTFGDVQSDIALRINGTRDEMSAVSSRVASRAVLASLHTVSPLLTQPILSPSHMAVTDIQYSRVASEFGSEVSQATSVASIFTADDVQTFVLQTYALMSSPTRAANAFVRAYVALGEQMYVVITSSFTAYDSFIKKSGIQTLALAGTTRDMLSHAPELITRMNLALGESVIEATQGAIQADVSLAYGTASAAPAAAQVVTTFIGNTGEVLARVTASAAVETATHTTFALRSFGDGLYEGTKSIQNVIYTTGPLLANAPAIIENMYLGVLGSSALVLHGLKNEIELALNSISTGLQSNTQLAAVLAAVQPVLAPGERFALAVYKSVHTLFDSAANTLALIIAPAPIIVMPNVVPQHVATATSSTPVSSPFLSGDSVSSKTTPYIIVQGVSSDYVNESLASLRSDILTTVAGLVQPVSNQTGTNSNTIQYVNMIQDLTGLIVRNGDFRGGVFDNGIRVSATGGNFTNLSGGTTSLGVTTITGGLTVDGILITGSGGGSGNVATSTLETAGNLPYWTSTAGTPAALGSAANLNWNNTNSLLTITGNASTTQFTATSSVYLATLGGSVGIGTTSPSQLLSVHGNSYVSGTSFFGGAITATSTLNITGLTTLGNASTTNLSISNNLWVGGNATTTSNGNFTTNGSIGIGVLAPTYALDVTGLGHFTGLVDAANFVATSTTISSIFQGGILVNNASSTITNLSVINATSTNATSTNLFSTNAVFTNATTTSLAISNLTSGRIPFITTGGSLADSTNFLWNTLTNLFTVTGNASTTQIGSTGSAYFATSGGNVGIGTTSPSQLLSVHGNGLFSGDLFAANITATGTLSVTGLTTFVNASTTNLSIANNLWVGGNATTTSNGNFTTNGSIGIGTTSPATTLSVVGNGYFTSGLGVGVVNTTGGSLKTTGTATVGSDLFLQALLNCSSSASAIQTDGSGKLVCGSITSIGGSSAGGWTWITPGYVKVSTSTDLVGIGMTPNASSPKLTINSGGVATTTLSLNAVSNQTANILEVYDNLLNLSSVISPAGYFGIGTSTPSQLLSVHGNSLFSGNLTAANITATGTLSANSLSLTTALPVSSGGTGQSTFTSSQLLYGNSTNALSSVATTTLAFSGPFTGASSLGALVGGSNSTITYTGLATTSQPSTSNVLYSTGGAGVAGAATSTLTATGLLSISNAPAILGASGAVITLPLAKGSFIVGDDAGTAQATSSIFISSIGQIGIGTTSPYSLFSLSNSATTAANTPLFTIASTTGGTSTSTLMTVLASGYVGVGTAAPAATFDVNGTAHIGTTANNNAQLLNISGGTGIQVNIAANDNSNYGLILGSDRTDGPVNDYHNPSGAYVINLQNAPLVLGTSNLARMTILGSGLVGIGTTSPSTNLSVQGNGLFSGDISAANITATGTITFSGQGTNMLASFNNSNQLVATSTPSAANYLATSTTATSTLQGGFSAGNNAALVVNQAATANSLYVNPSGNVGIGLTTPSYKLDVSGLVHVTGLVDAANFVATSTTISSIFQGGILVNSASSTITNLTMVNATTTNATSTNLAISSLTSGRIPFASTGGNLIDSGNFLWNTLTNLFTVTGNASTTQLTTTNNTYLATLGGNVGIGTTSPSQLLSVHGNGYFSGNLTAANITATGTATIGSLTGVVGANSGTLYAVASSSLFGFTPASNATTISTTYPLQGGGDLSTNRTFSLAFGTTTSNTWDGTQTFTNAPTLSTFSGLVAANNGISYATASSTLFGTGTGGQVLAWLSGTPTWTATSTIGVQGRGNGVLNQIAYWTDANTLSSNSNFLFNPTTNLFTVTGNASTTQLTTTGSTYLATLGGNVGIGTTSPFTNLSVHGNGYFSGNLTAANITATGTLSVAGDITLVNASTTNLSVANNLWVGGNATTTSNGNFTTNGYIGVGTTSPWAQLSINPNGITGPAFVIGSSTATNFIVASSGFVGIATSSPTYNFTVNQATSTSPANAIAAFTGNGGVGSWNTTTSLATGVLWHSSVVANGYVYVIGGSVGATAQRNVQFAKLNADGTVGTWASTTPLVAATRFHTSVVANGYVYTLGGTTPTLVQFAKINTNGTLGAWASTTPLATGESKHSTVVANGYVYVIGGDDGTQTLVQYARLNADGTLGSWQTTSSLPTMGAYSHTSVVANGYVYTIGGTDGASATTTVSYAKLNSDGTVGTWATTTPLGVTQQFHTSVVANGYVYAIGGSSNQVNIQYAKLNNNGTLGSWQSATALTTGGDSASSVVANGYVYVLGGNSAGNRVVQYAPLQRVMINGNLDLLSLAGGSLNDVNTNGSQGSTGGSIFAGNIFSNGTLEVLGNAMLQGGLGVNGNFTVNATTSQAQTYSIFSLNNATGTAPILSALYNGFVGIGTSTPNWNLQVAGTRPSFALSDASAAANQKHWLFSSMGGNLYIGTSSDAYSTSTVAALTLSNNGKIGVGTSSPWGLLSISGNGLASGAPQFVVGSSTTANFIVANSGYVGIGTNSPISPLQIVKTSAGAAVTSLTLTNADANANTGSQIDFNLTTTATALARIAGIRTNLVNSGDTDLAFSTTYNDGTVGLAERMRILSNGNIGIGTTSPAAGFAVHGTSYVSGSAFFGGAITATSSITANSLSLSTALPVSSGGTGQSTLTSSQLLYGNDTNALSSVATSTLAFSGPFTGASSLGALVGGSNSTITYTGLATTSQPSTSNVLYSTGGAGVAGAATSTLTATGLLSISNSPAILGAAGAVITLPLAKGNFIVGDDASTAQATSSIFISSTGQVGVGTTTPYSKLSVWGSGAGTNRLFELTNNASTTLASVLENGTAYFLGNLGLGTTSPSQLLSVHGNGLFSGNLSAANIIATGTLSVTGLTTLGYASTTQISSTGSAYFATSGGNVGIGTTSPYAKLSVVGSIIAEYFHATSTTATSTFAGGFVAGQCVAGDTKLRRRRRRTDGSYEYDEPDIIDIKAGDEIQSLDEKTGELVWSRVKQLAYMGKKQTYRLTTASGKTIRTTANHPYLARKTKNPHLSAGAVLTRSIVLIDYANIKAWARSKGMAIDLKMLRALLVASGISRVSIYYGADVENKGIATFMRKLRSFGYDVVSKPIQYFRITLTELLEQYANARWVNSLRTNARQTLVAEAERLDAESHSFLVPKANFDVEITLDAMRSINTFDHIILFSGDGDFVPLLAYIGASGKRTTVVSGREFMAGALHATVNTVTKLEDIVKFAPELVYALGPDGSYKKPTPAHEGRVWENCVPSIADLLGLSSVHKIAVDNLVKNGEGSWLKVAQLKEGMEVASATEDGRAVWDKIVSVEPVALEDVYDVEIEGTHNFIGNDIIAHNTAFTVNSTAPAGSLYVASSGNVGIGTTSPSQLLSVHGNGLFSGNLSAANITATGTLTVSGVSTFVNASTTNLSISNNLWVGGNATTTSNGTFTTNGSIGVGVTSPTYALDVSGLGHFTGLVDAANFVATSTTVSSIFQGGILVNNASSTITNLTMVNATSTNATTTSLAVSNLTSGRIPFITTGGSLADSGNFLWNNITNLFTITGNASTTQLTTTNSTYLATTGGNVGIGTTSPSQLLSVHGNGLFSGNLSLAGLTATGTIAFNEAARTSGTTPYLTLTAAADTGLTASTEASDVQFNLARTKTHANGNIVLQRDFLINAPTHAFVSFGAGLTTDLATFAISGAPITSASGNGTTTNAHTIYLGASTLNASTTNSYGLTVNANTGATNNYAAQFLGGSVGIGTTSPYAKLSVVGSIIAEYFHATSTTATSTFAGGFVAGQCVTADTKMRRRRRRTDGSTSLTTGDPYDYDEPDIIDIKEGDEIQSLDETTGALVWSKVRQLAYMGVKQTYRITTASGKTIRTTANHPYLVLPENIVDKKVKNVHTSRVFAFIDLANVFRGAESEGWKIDYERLRHYFATRYGVTRAFVFGGTSNRPDRVELHEQLVRLGYEVLLVPTRIFKDGTNKADVDSRMTFEMMRMEKEYDRAIVFTGDGDFYWVLEYLRTMKERVWLFGIAARTARDLKRLFRSDFSNISDLRSVLAVGEETQEAKTTRIFASSATYPFDVYAAGVDTSYQNTLPLVKGGVWKKVSELKEGQMIATTGANGKSMYERIVSLDPVAEEDVYDVEIEGTHNFIGNDIVAHNTAFTVNSTAPAGSLYVASSGNVGIGTTTPNSLLTLYTASSTAAGSPMLTFTASSTVSGLSAAMSSWTMGTDIASGGMFKISSSTVLGTNDRFVIDGAGNVGIGTTSPYAALSVVGSTGVVAGLFTATTTGFRGPDGSASAPAYSFASSTNTGFFNSPNPGSAALNVAVGGSNYVRFSNNSVPGALSITSNTNTFPNTDMNITTGGLSVSGSAGSTLARLYAVRSDANFPGALEFLRARGAIDAPTVITSGDPLGAIYANGFVGSSNDFQRAATILFDSTGTISDSTTGIAGIIRFLTADTGSEPTERMTILNSGNVGIGTSTPQWNLQVAGTRPSFALTDTAAAANLKHWLFSSQGGNLYIGTSTDAYATSSPAALTILNNGRLGIGTSSPSALLSISGSAYLGSGASSLLTIHSGTINYPISATSTILNNSIYAFSFATSTTATPLLSFNTTANQIATTSINGGFVIDNGALQYDGSTGITTISSLNMGPSSFDTDAGIVTWADMPTATTTAGLVNSYWAQMGGTPVLAIYGTTTTSGTITHGTVGIGTTTPPHTLTVQGGLCLTSGVGCPINEVAGGAYISNAVGIASTSPWALLSINPNGITGPSFAIGSSSATNFIVTNGGLVGIGTTSPSQLLSVHGNGLFSGNLTAANITATGTLSVSGVVSFANASTTNLSISNNLWVGGNATTTSNGNFTTNGLIGVGTTTPFATLQLATTTGKNLVLSDSGATANLKHWLFSSQGGNLYIGTSTDAYATSTPAALTVTNGGQILTTTGTAAAPSITFADDLTTGSFRPAASQYSISIAGTERMRVTANGVQYSQSSVGFVPSTFGFMVQNSAAASASVAAFLGYNYGTNTAGSSLVLRKSRGNDPTVPTFITTGDDLGQISTFGYVGDTNTYVEATRILSDSEGTISDSSTGIGGVLSFQTRPVGGSLAEVLRITSTGNVGISVTSPAYKLDVSGQGHFTGLVDAANFVATSTSIASTFAYNVGIGTTSPWSRLSVAGDVAFDSNILTIGSSTASTLTVQYLAAATSTIRNNSIYAFSFATSTTATPILSFNTTGNIATTSINGGFSVDSGALEYDGSTGVTSIASLNVGPSNFDTDAGIVSWIDMPSATTTAGIINSYSAQMSATPVLTIYGLTTTATGTLSNLSVGIGTTTPNSLLTLYTASSTAAGSPMLTFSASSTASGLANSIYSWTIGTDIASGGKFKISSSTVVGTNDRLVIDAAGNVGIGTSSPYTRLAISDTGASALRDVFTISTSTSGLIFKVDSYGQTFADGAYTGTGADYAEYFYTNSVGLQSGEVVCVDVVEKSAVKRCERGADNNVMGIVSTKPSVIGNSIKAVETDPSHYAVIGMLGQVEAYVSAENGPINIGDSLTSASSTPGYAMLADGGDSTVGIALESIATSTGKIKVLISRRNKSLAVEEVETLVVERIANMKIEDRVQQMITQGVENLNLDPRIQRIAQDEAGKLNSLLTIGINDNTGAIARLNAVLGLSASSTSSAISVDANENVGVGTNTPHYKLDVNGLVGAHGFIVPSDSAALSFIVGTTTIVAALPSSALTADGTGVDLYKLATFTLAGVQALAEKVALHETRITSLETRLAALESGSISSATASPISLSSDTLTSVLSDLGIFIQHGIAQFNRLVFRELVASSDENGTSSAGSVTITAGNTVAQINNSLVLPTTKVFVTFNSQLTATWWVSDKTAGFFRVVLSAPQTTDVSFDYFLVQTEGQIATSTPLTNVGTSYVPSVTQGNGEIDMTGPVMTLIGDSPLHLSLGGTFTEPGVTTVDNVDGAISQASLVTFVNGIEGVAAEGTIDTGSETTYIITYKATDRAGNSSTVTRAVIVGGGSVVGASSDVGTSDVPTSSTSTPATTDSTPPTISLLGEAAMEVAVGGIFLDPGAVARDDVDGDLMANILVSGGVDTATPGLYTVTYSVLDAAGNAASVSRVVTVAAAPTLSVGVPTSDVGNETASSTPSGN